MFYETNALIYSIGKNEKVRIYLEELAGELGREPHQLEAELFCQLGEPDLDQVHPVYRGILQAALGQVDWHDVAACVLGGDYYVADLDQ